MATDYSISIEMKSRELAPLEQLAGKKLRKIFYLQNCLRVAKELIGKILVRKDGNKIYAGIIVETEAYLGDKDPASHAFRGMTKRNKVMFDKGGVCYVYFTYGNHYCMNVVAGKKDVAHAVLLRAIEPLKGIDHMKENRGIDKVYNLTNGPGKLTQALGIDANMNGCDFSGSRLYIADSKLKDSYKIKCSKRIGISKNSNKLWRFFVDENPFVSGVSVTAVLKKNRK